MTAVHLLARHPEVEICGLTSRSLAGKPYSHVFPVLDLTGDFTPELPSGLDAVFSCLPHNVGAAAAHVWIDDGARIIDMSADFRLHDPAQYPRWYGQAHPAPELLAQAVLGLPELHESQIKDARLVAAPGCYSTASILALAPAVAAGLVGSDVVVDGNTPATKLTSHSNLCLVNVSAQGRKAVVTAALDNLVKGASGQGVECFNLAFGFERTTALTGAAQWP